MKQNYFIGLDIGTDSVGWAVTDMDYNLLKANKKDLWGVRVFNQAKTAGERRANRTNRRRLARRRQRIEWLQQLFDEEISKVDPTFFLRLKESKFYSEDKDERIDGKHTLFLDKGFTDKEYYDKYPTIYHLRKDILTSSKVFDVRLVYLAIHHIIKNRGHFLLENTPSDELVPFQDAYITLAEYLYEEFEVNFTPVDIIAFETHLKDRSMNITQKRKALKQDAGTSKDDALLNAVIDLMAGAKVSLINLYQDDNLKNLDPSSISLKDNFDDIEDALKSELGDRYQLIAYVKAIYDWAVLDNILAGHKYLSCAMVQSYDKHASDLATLKDIVKEFLPKSYYNEIFRECRKDLNNYSAYSGKTKCNYRCDYDEFEKYLRKVLDPIINKSPKIKEILDELSYGTFLPKQVTKSNSVIPSQLNRKELVDILEHAKTYLPFLSDPDKNGKTVGDKIIAIFDFRIPYYVGPLNRNSEASWVERTSEKIYPWNFQGVVDFETSAEKFVERLTSKCTYVGKQVLPKDSLLYSEYMVLNELNNLRINGKRVAIDIKNNILRDLFMKSKRVTFKRLVSYLRSIGAIEKDDSISGIDGDFKASMYPHIIFKDIIAKIGSIGVEDIIKHVVCFSDDQNMLRNWVSKNYGELLSKSDINLICKQKFSGWGRLSREFLTEVYHVELTGEAVSIIEMLRKSNYNLMELLSNRFNFKDALEKYNSYHNNMTVTSAKEYVDNSYASPAIKRAILQSIGIVDEIVKCMNKVPPRRIFVEMARGEDEKKRTISRKNTLIELYKKCGEEANPLFSQLESNSDSDLRKDKLYLYYTQLGKCMYSGRPIEIERLDIDYDIDHIFPQSRIKDDSLNNRVLVERTLNHEKGNKYPIDQNIRKAMTPFWHMLKEKGLISGIKFERLTRATKFTEDELASFIARQLVETRQSSKIVADILKKRYGAETEIVYVKAGNVSEFRHAQLKNTFDFVKCRLVNDFHHAKDAYLNIVVGNVYHVKFTSDPRYFLRENANWSYSLNKVFDYPVERNGEVAWTPKRDGKEGSIAVVQKNIRRNSVLFTRLATEVGGALYDVNIVEKGRGQAPIKTSDPRMTTEKYGGYNKLTGAYFFLVEHKKGKMFIRSIETVYLMYKEQYEKNPERYCIDILKLVEPKIVIKRIKFGSLFSYDGFRMHISARTGDNIIFRNANQLLLESQWHHYINQISKYSERCKIAKTELPVTRYDAVTSENNLKLYERIQDKLKTNAYSKRFSVAAQKLDKCKTSFSKKTILDQCNILLSLIRLFSSGNATGADLTLLGESKNTSRISVSKRLSGSNQYIIHQSITGIFEQKIDLSKVKATSIEVSG